MKHFLPSTAALCAVAAPVTANPLSYTNDTGGSVTFYGQVSPAIVSFHDGEDTATKLVDNSRSNTRVGFNLDQAFGTSRLRFNFETALALPGSSAFTQDESDNPDWDWEETDIRRVELIYSGSFGAVSLGQGSMASDGISGSDLSGTTLVSSVTTADTAGGYFWRLNNGDLSNVALGDTYDDFDGSRRGRIRYETPDFEGVTFAVAVGKDVLGDPNDKTYYDVAAYYEGELSGFELAAGLGYAWVEEPDVDTIESYAASVSALHLATGLNGTLAGGSEIDGGNYIYGKIGWIGDLVALGQTAFSADLYSGNDFASDGSTSSQWGLQAAQRFDDLSLEAYLGYAEYSFDEDNANYQDASSVTAGMRWRF